MLNFYKHKPEDDYNFKLGVGWFKYSSTRYSPREGCKVRETGFYFTLYVGRTEYVFNYEKLKLEGDQIGKI